MRTWHDSNLTLRRSKQRYWLGGLLFRQNWVDQHCDQQPAQVGVLTSAADAVNESTTSRVLFRIEHESQAGRLPNADRHLQKSPSPHGSRNFSCFRIEKMMRPALRITRILHQVSCRGVSSAAAQVFNSQIAQDLDGMRSPVLRVHRRSQSL